MAFTAFECMKQRNQTRYGQQCGPFQPKLYRDGKGNDLKTAALRFLRTRCEELRFSAEKTAEEQEKGVLLGTSLKPGQIPYNMQMDIDRLCLEKALERFMDSGTAEDAYQVYYCYLEMFIGSYGKSKTMIELLSEFEQNGSALLLKHRDHYSHSVYVFALGLAIYECNEKYRQAFQTCYKAEGKKAAHLYLEFWGLTALFHDIGYPFELPFEQVMSYFEVDKAKRSEELPTIAYHSLEHFLALEQDETEHFRALYGKEFSLSTQLLAHDITQKLGEAYQFDEATIFDQIQNKPSHPEKYNYFMDHAFFSAARLYRELKKTIGVEKITPVHVDALSAILLHNSLFKFSILFFKSSKRKAPLSMELHPLAFMLMLCDELQCWDRTAYGRTSRSILYPMAVDFDFSDQAISACYHYDSEASYKINLFEQQLADYQSGKSSSKPRLKSYSDMTGKNDFAEEIKEIVDLREIPFAVTPDTRPMDRSKKHIFLSSSSFIHLYDFAALLSARRKLSDAEGEIPLEPILEGFDKLSLEYKIQHLERAKYFSRYLHRIGCFYTDKPVDFDLLTQLTPEQMEIIAPMEHERWLSNHEENGWVYGDLYETCTLKPGETRQELREQLRCHKLMLDGNITAEAAIAHYHSLSPEDQDKDVEPMNWMLKIIRRLDGVKIYSLN